MLPLTSLNDLYDQTLQARKFRGWAAVAPTLEPYLSADRWRSGAPLPDALQAAVARRRRNPPWMPSSRRLLLQFIASCVACVVVAGFVYHSKASKDAGSDERRQVVAIHKIPLGLMFALALLPLLLLLLGSALLRNNQEVRQHVHALYVIYITDKADPEAKKDLVHQVRLGRQVYVVYANGECSVMQSGAVAISGNVGQGGGADVV